MLAGVIAHGRRMRIGWQEQARPDPRGLPHRLHALDIGRRGRQRASASSACFSSISVAPASRICARSVSTLGAARQCPARRLPRELARRRQPCVLPVQ